MLGHSDVTRSWYILGLIFQFSHKSPSCNFSWGSSLSGGCPFEKHGLFRRKFTEQMTNLWADRVKPFSKQQGVNINFEVFEKTHGSPS